MEPLLIVKVCNAHHIVDTYLCVFLFILISWNLYSCSRFGMLTILLILIYTHSYWFSYLETSTHMQSLECSSYCWHLFMRIPIYFNIMEPLLIFKVWNTHHIVYTYLCTFILILIPWNLYSYSKFWILIILLTLIYTRSYWFLYLGISTHIPGLEYSSYGWYIFIRIHSYLKITKPLLIFKVWNTHHIVDTYLYAFIFILIS